MLYPDTFYVIPSITSAQVSTMLQKLRPYKAADIDNISSQLLRIAAPVIARHRLKIEINFSFIINLNIHIIWMSYQFNKQSINISFHDCLK